MWLAEDNSTGEGGDLVPKFTHRLELRGRQGAVRARHRRGPEGPRGARLHGHRHRRVRSLPEGCLAGAITSPPASSGISITRARSLPTAPLPLEVKEVLPVRLADYTDQLPPVCTEAVHLLLGWRVLADQVTAQPLVLPAGVLVHVYHRRPKAAYLRFLRDVKGRLLLHKSLLLRKLEASDPRALVFCIRSRDIIGHGMLREGIHGQ